MKEEAEIFVRVDNVVGIRKELLMASKDVLQLLKNYEDYKNLRTEKLQLMLKLYRVMTHLLNLDKQLKNSLPKVALHKTPVIQQHLSEKQISGSKTQKSKLEVLEDELAEIESRLSSLS